MLLKMNSYYYFTKFKIKIVIMKLTLPKNLSPSRASQYKTCPKQYMYQHVVKISEPTNEVQAKGTTIHQALEDLFDLPPKERTIENLHNLFRNAWTAVRSNDEHHHLFSSVEKEREWGLDALKRLNYYMELEDPSSFEPLERERWVKGSIEDLNLRGILDRMDENLDGELVIVDYKSGKAPLQKWKEPRFFAMKIYALLIYKELGIMPKELKLIYLENKTVHTLEVDEEMLENAKNEVLEIWSNIKESYSKNEFPTKTSILCNYCYFQPICPEYNGSAPDVEELKKLNFQINEVEESIEVHDMFTNINDLPKDNEMRSFDKENASKKYNQLKSQKSTIEKMILKELANKNHGYKFSKTK